MTKIKTCENCGTAFKTEANYDKCSECAEHEAMKAIGKIEPPKGGWPKGSDMDKI